ncbi:MAG: protein translocase subunit SecD [Proteobacteria bacterium]|nr:protein translocase subunit SecD [Pseudomonadota bacterium]
MEGNYLFRVLGILALFLGSTWVLLPTILQADVQSQLAESAAAVDTPLSEGDALNVLFEADDPASVIDAFEDRLEALEVAVDAVYVKDEKVAVRVTPGTTFDQAEAALKAAPATVHALVAQAEALPEVLEGSALAADFVGKPVQGLALTLTPVTRGSGLAVEGDTSVFGEEGPRWVALAVDGTIAAVAEVAADGALSTHGLTLPQARIVLPALGAPVVRYVAPSVVEIDETVATVESNVPVWLQGSLPATKLNLGLDLQGGIDLTLQVELEEAVLAKVARDLAYFKDMAEEEGLVVESAKPDAVLPNIHVTSNASLSDVQAFFAKRMSDYAYSETEGTTHTFAIREEVSMEVSKQAVEQVLETLRNRVDATGVKEPSIVKKGGGRINVQLPGAVDAQAAVEALGTTAMLQFRLVDEDFDQIELAKMIADAERDLPPEQYADDEVLNRYFWRSGRLPDERWVLWEYSSTAGEDGKVVKVRETAHVVKEVALTGGEVNDASVAWDPNTQFPYVALEFKPRGATDFCTLTRENVGKRFAIVLDEEVRSAPTIRDQICGGRASIEMGAALDALQDANTLSLVLRTGSLTAPVSIGQVRQVGPTLGADAIRAGTYGTGIGATLVLLFMLLWYRVPGMLANVALFLNVFLVFAFLALFGATLTLPGIAGVALTVGMAVDANIIIYERIREELRLGVHARKAVDAGFEKATWAVLDANITTAIAGVVLYSYGSGPIKGFAVTLLIGIITTLITALFVNRTFLELATRRSSATLRF